MLAEHSLPFSAEVAERYDLKSSDIASVLTCTAAQESLFALSIKHPSAYVARYVYALNSNIDVTQFCDAYESTARSHATLRTRFIQSDSGDICQVVLRHNPRPSRELCQDLETYLREDCQKGISWGDNIARAALIECPGQEALHLVLTLHHVAYDDWALAVFLENLESVYLGTKEREDGSFNEFAQFCSRTMESPVSTDFWRTELSKPNAALWPETRPHHHTRATRSSIHRTRLDQTTSFDNGCCTALLAWSTLMAAYTGSEHVVFGVTSTGRRAPVPRVGTMGGPTIATFPLNMILDPSKGVIEEWTDLQRRLNAIVEHEQYGLRNMNVLSPEAAHACSFQNLVVLQPRRKDNYALLKEVTSALDLNNHSTFGTYPVTFVIEIADQEISVEVVYDEKVVDERQIQHLQWQLSQILLSTASAVTHDHRHTSVATLSQPCMEAVSQMRAWNQEIQPRATRQLQVHSIFADKVKQQPSSLAVAAWDGEFTYEKLDRLSDGLAAHLLTKHTAVKSDVIIPLLFEKSKWTTVAILGVLKAGAAFTLMDPATPLDRLKTIYHDTCAPLVICNGETLSTARRISDKVVALEDVNHSDQIPGPPPDPEPNSLLYAMFTSGSTGKPKGVLIEHAAFCHSVLSYIHKSGLNSGSRTLQYASYAFDVAVTDHLATLIGGGCICIPSGQDCSVDLASQIRNFNINYADLTPSILRTLTPKDMPSVKTVLIGGEPMSYEDVAIWAEKVRLVNIYGPAECCVLSTMQTAITRETDARNIGFATGGSCWITDANDHNKLLPVGAIGELLIGGPILGRGYLNDLEKTADAFIPAPSWYQDLGYDKQSRLYKTGDMVKRHPDGSLLFLGRKDLQVKIRGQRIELGEIEHCMRREFGNDAIVVDVVNFARSPSASTLTAFVYNTDANGSQTHKNVLGEASSSLQSRYVTVAAQLRTELPKYMIPEIVLPVNRFPLTATGKTDRKHLKQIAAELEEGDYLKYIGNSSGQQKGIPSTRLQRTLHETISEQTGLRSESIGTHDNLVSLGLDSISIMKTVGLLRQRGLKLSVADFYASPTIVDLARILSDPESINENITSVTSAETREQKMQRLYAHFADSLPTVTTRQTQALSQTAVLLTGCSGSLGAYVLDSLIRNPCVSSVYCATRRDQPAEYQHSVHTTKRLTTDFSKVRFLFTDLAAPQLGLSPDLYSSVQNEVSHVLHLAWTVNFMLPLEGFEPQIKGVRQLIEFCVRSHRNTSLIFASSMGVTFGEALQRDASLEVPEASLPDWSSSPASGYAEAKHICEALIAAACSRSGLRGNILRLGQIAGPINVGCGGHWGEKEWFPTIVGASQELGVLPGDLGPLDAVDWIPVDVMADISVELALGDTQTGAKNDGAHPRFFHLVCPSRTPWGSLAASVSSWIGAQLIPFREWVGRISSEEYDGVGMHLSGYYRGMQAQMDSMGPYKPLGTRDAAAASRTLRELDGVSSRWIEKWMEQWKIERR